MIPLAPALRDAEWLTVERVRRFAVVFLIAALFVIGRDLWLHTRHGVVNGAGEQLGRDFVNYWAGARRALEGQAAAAYDIQGFWAYERSLTAPNAEFKWYGYPPIAMLLALPIAVLPFGLALAVWTLAGLALVAWVLSGSLGWRWAAVVAFAAPASMLNMVAGQNGAFSAALMAGGVLLLRRRPLLAGVLFGALCYKPHLGLMIPVALLAAGQWRAILAAGGAVAALGLGSMMLAGADAWAAFLHNAPIHTELLEASPGIWPRMPSVYVATRWLGATSPVGFAIQALVAAAAAAVVFRVWRSGASDALKGVALLVGTFLATPYAWDYDLIMLTVAAVWFWTEASATGWRPWEKITLALLVVFPLVTAMIAAKTHLQPGPLVLALLLGLTARRALAAPAGSSSPAPIAPPAANGAFDAV